VRRRARHPSSAASIAGGNRRADRAPRLPAVGGRAIASGILFSASIAYGQGWPMGGQNLENSRSQSVTKISPQNVGALKQKWVFKERRRSPTRTRPAPASRQGLRGATRQASMTCRRRRGFRRTARSRRLVRRPERRYTDDIGRPARGRGHQAVLAGAERERPSSLK
jgi:hypothetical protein